MSTYEITTSNLGYPILASHHCKPGLILHFVFHSLPPPSPPDVCLQTNCTEAKIIRVLNVEVRPHILRNAYSADLYALEDLSRIDIHLSTLRLPT